jgi:glutathione peroxidase-family protein
MMVDRQRAFLSFPVFAAMIGRPTSPIGMRMSLPSDIPLKTIDGKAETLGVFDGKAQLIVNVGSKCGFTPQYAGLEALHKRFSDRGFAVLGFPCDQFDHQERATRGRSRDSAR